MVIALLLRIREVTALLLESLIRDFLQINYPILWGGRLARPMDWAGKMPTPQEVVEYFYLSVPDFATQKLPSPSRRGTT